MRESRLLLWYTNGRLSLVESGSGEEEPSPRGGGGEPTDGEGGCPWWGREVEDGEVEEEATEECGGGGSGGEPGGAGGVFGGAAGGVLGRRLGLLHCSSRGGLSRPKSSEPSVSATAAAMTEAGGSGGGAGGGVGVGTGPPW